MQFNSYWIGHGVGWIWSLPPMLANVDNNVACRGVKLVLYEAPWIILDKQVAYQY
jgi:hypothetical protein